MTQVFRFNETKDRHDVIILYDIRTGDTIYYRACWFMHKIRKIGMFTNGNYQFYPGEDHDPVPLSKEEAMLFWFSLGGTSWPDLSSEINTAKRSLPISGRVLP